MPKRINNLMSKIADINNVRIADEFARKGKKKKYGVIKHDKHREEENKNISSMLRTGTYKVSPYKVQELWEYSGNQYKKRILKKLPYYPDRIAQWAMMNELVPIWDKLFIKTTYSCIKGRGTHACAKDVQKALRSDKEGTKYCLKFDIKKCYDSIKHHVLKHNIAKKIKDFVLTHVLNGIIDSTDGIPIGSFPSQYFMNVYFTYFDHWVKEILHVKYYFRYADDLTVFAQTKQELHQIKERVFTYIKQTLELEVKSNWQIFPTDIRSVDFVGYKFYHTHTLLRKSTKKRLMRLVYLYHAGKISIKKFERRIAAYLGWLKYCDSKNLLQKIEWLTNFHFSNWRGIKLTFKAIKDKLIRLVDLDVHKKFFKINFVFRHKSWFIKSCNKTLLETLIPRLSTNVVF